MSRLDKTIQRIPGDSDIQHHPHSSASKAMKADQSQMPKVQQSPFLRAEKRGGSARAASSSGVGPLCRAADNSDPKDGDEIQNMSVPLLRIKMEQLSDVIMRLEAQHDSPDADGRLNNLRAKRDRYQKELDRKVANKKARMDAEAEAAANASCPDYEADAEAEAGRDSLIEMSEAGADAAGSLDVEEDCISAEWLAKRDENRDFDNLHSSHQIIQPPSTGKPASIPRGSGKAGARNYEQALQKNMKDTRQVHRSAKGPGPRLPSTALLIKPISPANFVYSQEKCCGCGAGGILVCHEDAGLKLCKPCQRNQTQPTRKSARRSGSGTKVTNVASSPVEILDDTTDEEVASERKRQLLPIPMMDLTGSRVTRRSGSPATLWQKLAGLQAVFPPQGGPDSIPVVAEDLSRLAPEEFLNDSIIDFYMRYLWQNLRDHTKQRCHFFNPYFYKKLTEKHSADRDSGIDRIAKKHNRVSRWTKATDIFSKDFLFVPIHDHLHWSLAIVCHPAGFATGKSNSCILHLDSLPGGHSTQTVSTPLRSYLLMEWNEKMKQGGETVPGRWAESQGSSPKPQAATIENCPAKRLKLPRQANHCDCGLFLLTYLEYFLYSVPNITAIDLTSLSDLESTVCKGFLAASWFKPTNASMLRDYLQDMVLRLLKQQSNMDPKDPRVAILEEQINQYAASSTKYLPPKEDLCARFRSKTEASINDDDDIVEVVKKPNDDDVLLDDPLAPSTAATTSSPTGRGCKSKTVPKVVETCAEYVSGSSDAESEDMKGWGVVRRGGSASMPEGQAGQGCGRCKTPPVSDRPKWASQVLTSPITPQPEKLPQTEDKKSGLNLKPREFYDWRDSEAESHSAQAPYQVEVIDKDGVDVTAEQEARKTCTAAPAQSPAKRPGLIRQATSLLVNALSSPFLSKHATTQLCPGKVSSVSEQLTSPIPRPAKTRNSLQPLMSPALQDIIDNYKDAEVFEPDLEEDHDESTRLQPTPFPPLSGHKRPHSQHNYRSPAQSCRAARSPGDDEWKPNTSISSSPEVDCNAHGLLDMHALNPSAAMRQERVTSGRMSKMDTEECTEAPSRPRNRNKCRGTSRPAGEALLHQDHPGEPSRRTKPDSDDVIMLE